VNDDTIIGFKKDSTALLLVDPYNDFLSEGGILFPRIKGVADEVGLMDNLRKIMSVVRAIGIQVFIVPHRRWQPGDYEDWRHPNPTQQLIQEIHLFAKDSWGGEWHPEFAPQGHDVVVHEHWGQSGFPNTDLDMQLKQHGISHVVLVGLLANSCIESTGRYAMELGYHVTLVRDATAAFSQEMMRSAHELNGPTFAHSILKTAELVDVLSQISHNKAAGFERQDPLTAAIM
jgi:nicotinamidase-related amidase